MTDFLPEYKANAVFTGGTGGALVFGEIPSTSLAAQLFPFYKGDAGPMGPVGPMGPASAQRRVIFSATDDGEQIIDIGIAPTAGRPVHVFINGILHMTPADYSTAGATLTLTEGVGVFSGDHISIIYQ
jgi:hypothetical protein